MDQNEIVEQVYAFIKAYIREHTHPPTLSEIADGCFMSRTHVTRYVERLEGMGRLFREPNRARGITLIDNNEDE
jgi:SOS-response transcriptional repressor LexA